MTSMDVNNVIQPLSMTMSGTTDSLGKVVFTFPYVPISQDWVFSVNIAEAPATAVFVAENQPTNLGTWTGWNSAGPYVLSGGDRLSVTGVVLLPSTIYTCTITGEVVTSGTSRNYFPYPIASSTVSQNQAGLQSLNLSTYNGALVGNIFYGSGATSGNLYAYNTITGTTIGSIATSTQWQIVGVSVVSQTVGWFYYGGTSGTTTGIIYAQEFNPTTMTTIGSAYSYSIGTTGFIGQCSPSPNNQYFAALIENGSATSATLVCFNTSTLTWNGYNVTEGTTYDFTRWNWSTDSSYLAAVIIGYSGGYRNFLFVYSPATNTAVLSSDHYFGGTILYSCPIWTSGNQLYVLSGSNWATTSSPGSYFFLVSFTYSSGTLTNTGYITTSVPFNYSPYNCLYTDGTTIFANGASSTLAMATVNISTGAYASYSASISPSIFYVSNTSPVTIYCSNSTSTILAFSTSTLSFTTATTTSTATGAYNYQVFAPTQLSAPPAGYAYRIHTITAYNSATSTGTLLLSTNQSNSSGVFACVPMNTTLLLNGRLINKTIYAATTAASGTTQIEIGYDLVWYDLTQL